MLSRLKRWISRNRGVTHSVIAIAFGAIGLLTAFIVWAVEHKAGPVNALELLLLALVTPSAFALLYIAEVATAYITGKWAEEDREAIFVETFRTAAEMAARRLEVVRSVEKNKLTEHVYCTSHCNLFDDPGGHTPAEAESVYKYNYAFFSALAERTVAAEPGLKLLLHYPDEKAFAHEMGERIDIYLAACEKAQTSLALSHFEPRHLLQKSLKDYFVFEDHVFKTIRKTPHSAGATEYMHIKSAKVAAQYRAWLEDLFNFGEGASNKPPFVERVEFEAKYLTFKAKVEAERRAAKS